VLEIQRWKGKSIDELREEGFTEEEIRAIKGQDGRTFRPAFINGVRREAASEASAPEQKASGFRERLEDFHRSED